MYRIYGAAGMEGISALSHESMPSPGFVCRSRGRGCGPMDEDGNLPVAADVQPTLSALSSLSMNSTSMIFTSRGQKFPLRVEYILIQPPVLDAWTWNPVQFRNQNIKPTIIIGSTLINRPGVL
jgi:hypothetical protein